VPRVHIRRAAQLDIEAIVSLENVSFGASAWPARLFEQYLEHCGDLFLVASLGGRVAAYSITCYGPTRAELHSIAVHPHHRAMGLAGRLLRHSEVALRRRRVEAWFLSVRRSNVQAIALYKRFGFEPARRLRAYYEDGEDGWRMRKSLVYTE
jgi:ribosomal-protein-alanine N-acetyltransferase